MRLLDFARSWLAPAGFAVAVLATPAQPADAAIISLNYTIAGTGFTGGTPSADPATISFSVTFDASASIYDSTAGLVIYGANFDIGSVFSYTYIASFDELHIGGGPNGVSILAAGNADFEIVLNEVTVSSPPHVVTLIITGPESSEQMSSGSATLTPYVAPQATPEPASLALFGVAMAAFGTLRARRKHRQAA